MPDFDKLLTAYITSTGEDVVRIHSITPKIVDDEQVYLVSYKNEWPDGFIDVEVSLADLLGFLYTKK